VIADAAPVDLLQAMVAAGKPVSLVSHRVPSLPIPTVSADNMQGVGELVQHVVEGCQRQQLVFIRGLSGQWDADGRENAFRQEIMRYNLHVPPAHMLRGDFSASMAAHSLQTLIANGARFDAVIAADYLMAIAAVETLRGAGYRVPDDVSVVGFGDAREAEAAGLTTVAADVVEQGRRAARQLLSQINGLRIRGMTVLSVRLIVRDTSLPQSVNLP
jgi:DNA-binding LacI/PurR family transcriptional regulator